MNPCNLAFLLAFLPPSITGFRQGGMDIALRFQPRFISLPFQVALRHHLQIFQRLVNLPQRLFHIALER